MPVTVTLEGEHEARISALVDSGKAGSALVAVQDALKLAERALLTSGAAETASEASDPPRGEA